MANNNTPRFLNHDSSTESIIVELAQNGTKLNKHQIDILREERKENREFTKSCVAANLQLMDQQNNGCVRYRRAERQVQQRLELIKEVDSRYGNKKRLTKAEREHKRHMQAAIKDLQRNTEKILGDIHEDNRHYGSALEQNAVMWRREMRHSEAFLRIVLAPDESAPVDMTGLPTAETQAVSTAQPQAVGGHHRRRHRQQDDTSAVEEAEPDRKLPRWTCDDSRVAI